MLSCSFMGAVFSVYVIKIFIWEQGGWFTLGFFRFRFRPAMGAGNAINATSARDIDVLVGLMEINAIVVFS